MNNGYGRGLGPSFSSHGVNGPQGNNPYQVRGPLAQGSNWPYEVLIYPGSAGPAYAKTFNLYQELEVAVTDTWVTVVDVNLGRTEEGRVLQWAGEEEGAVGSDLFWRIIQDDSKLGRYDVMRGGWSQITLPQQITTPIPQQATVALQVFLPAAGGAPRTVRGLMRGWSSPFEGGGTFAEGYAR